MKAPFILRFLCVKTVLVFLFQIWFPAIAWALTGGPSQPEVQSFEPVGTSQMVDVSTGDFTYNIPLIDVGGYPINLSYHAGIGMDQEASWVGLGWNINPGVINRDVRGIPDDFNGDMVTNELSTLPNVTWGVNAGLSAELFGFEVLENFDALEENDVRLGLSVGIYKNNYKGVGIEFSVDPSISPKGTPLTTNLSIGANSQEGIDINASAKIGLDYKTKRDKQAQEHGLDLFVGSAYNSRSGLKALNYGFTTKNIISNLAAESFGASHSFASPTYFPNLNFSSTNSHMSANMTTGIALFGGHPNLRVTGYSQEQSIADKTLSKAAYGYFYEQNQDGNNVLLDFNREKDGPYSRNSTNIPLANHTYDVFTVSGQGIGGSYRLFRSDFTHLHSDRKTTRSVGGQGGLEFGAGGLAHLGVNANANWSDGFTGKWDNPVLSNSFGAVSENDNPSYEPAYFKIAGEPTILDANYYSKMGEDHTVAVHLDQTGSLKSSLFDKEGIEKTVYSQQIVSHYRGLDTKTENTKTERESRHTLLSGLTAGEASVAGLDRGIADYSYHWLAPVEGNPLGFDNISREEHPQDHFSEMTVTDQSGARYVYGIPAYNTYQVEKTFNVTGRTSNCASGQVTYDPTANDNNSSNALGIDHYYSSRETPEYAHSYLLTGYLSPDYVDITGDGITDDDLGTAVKFNYARVHNDYKWRVPYNSNSANYVEGMQTTANDDKGMYVYGEKEIWYLHSIETKTHVAVFYTSWRADGLGVAGENGGEGSDKLRQLDRIVLYAKHDYLKFEDDAEPIKTVYFDYNYSLCDSIDNSSTGEGKLTLEKVFFVYGNSMKGRLSSYEFSYSSVNPDYNLKGSDGWGTYKPNNMTCGEVNNIVFPYAEQDSTTAAQNASAWALKEIKLPSGGVISIEYESDDYAYVQDQQAMKMFIIEGFGHSDDIGNISSSLFDGKDHTDVVYFELEETITGGSASEEVQEKYLKNMTELQYTIYVDMDSEGNHEYVKGYCEIDWNKGCGVTSNGTIGWVAIKTVNQGDKHDYNRFRQVNPMARYAWNFAKLYTPHLIYPSSGPDQDGTLTTLTEALGGFHELFKDIRYMAKGFNASLEKDGFCSTVNTDQSWIRLRVPSKKKYGGGHRVKKIALSDAWATIGAGSSGASDFEYGQEYIYSMSEIQDDGSTMDISSGVASYEPFLIGDENPFRQARPMTNELLLIPDQESYIEEPLGESFFPAPVVVYRKVQVRALQHQDVEQTATGYTEHQFYTAFDFPTIVKETDPMRYSKDPVPFWSIFKFNKTTEDKVSQGYTVILNDMHGKPRSQFTYAENAEHPLSGTVFVYNVDSSEAKLRLDNTVQTVDREGEIRMEELAVEVDFAADSRSSYNRSYSAGLSKNADVIPLFGPISIPVLVPRLSNENLYFKSISTTKVIKQYGLLKKTLVYKNGATLESENLLYDRQTGHVLLTSVQNEFKDNTYNLSKPAYWAYDQMGPAYENIGLQFTGVDISTEGNIILPNSLNSSDYLNPGDECLITYSGSAGRVVYVHDGDDGTLNLIDRFGTPITKSGASNPNVIGEGTFTLKVIRSGKKNITMPQMENVQTRTNPLVEDGGEYSLAISNVLNSSAIEYSDNWGTLVGYHPYMTIEETELYDDWNYLMDCFLSHTPIGLVKYVASVTLGDSLGLISNADTTKYDSYNPLTFYRCDSLVYFNSSSSKWESFNPFDEASVNGREITINVWGGSNGSVGSIDELSCDSWFNSSVIRDSIVALLIESNPGHEATINSSDADDYYISYSGQVVNESLVITLEIEHQVYHIGCPYTLTLPLDVPYSKITSIQGMHMNPDVNSEQAIIRFNAEDECGNSGVIAVEADFECLDLWSIDLFCYQEFEELPINPYLSGLKGNWHPIRNRTYLEEREYSTPLNIREDGSFKSYEEYYSYNSGTDEFDRSTNERWVWATEITKFTPYGNEVENKDALGRYSSAIYGYQYSVPIAVAANAEYTQIGFDGFEDYVYHSNFGSLGCNPDHFSFRLRSNPSNAILEDSISHTGRFCLKVASNEESEITIDLEDPTIQTSSYDEDYARVVKLEDNIGKFKPSSGEYLISGWVKEARDASDTTFSEVKIEIELTDEFDVTSTIDCHASGYIIEGWQRIEQKINIPEGTKSIKITLVASDDADSWFDDIRIFPYEGNMNSYVYDYRTLRLWAELDENNYATFYEYDKEGSLIRVKKETERGIMTLKESRSHYHKPTTP